MTRGPVTTSFAHLNTTDSGKNMLEAQRGLARWFGEYNTARPHQALDYATPGELYHSPESYDAKPAAWRWK